jgi:GT2 family glycosyltransferase
MTNEPVTLLVPNYNSGKFLRHTLPALLHQTYPACVVRLMDNCSTDDSVAFAEQIGDPRLQVVRATEHLPIMGNFNRAAATVDTPYFALCAADEMYEPSWVAEMVRLLGDHPQAFFAVCKTDSADEEGRVYLADAERYKATFWPTQEPCLFQPVPHAERFQKGNCLLITAGLFRTAAFREIGPLNEDYQFVADWEYWFRGLFAGQVIVGSHRPLVHYRRHVHMTTRKLAADLHRFREEHQLLEWVARERLKRGLAASDQPQFGLLRNTIASEFAARLAAGDHEGADKLLQFATETIPGFQRSFVGRVLRGARIAGRTGGHVLRWAEKGYVRLLALLPRR